MNKKEKLVNSAREWLNTKWHHNQCVKNVGVDCINFLYASGIEAGLTLSPIPEVYGRIAYSDGIKSYLNQHFHLKQYNEIELGDILLFQFSGYNNHVAIATSFNTMIHASASHEKVVEHSIDGIWRRMLKGVWMIK